MIKIELNLLDNGLDYIYEAVRPIFSKHDNSQHSWKYSVLHIYSGIELLLKEKLKQEHWSLIFQDVGNADIKNLENGNFVSVYHEELVKRLRNISKVIINDEPIKSLRDLRNRFEHFEVNIALTECEKTVVSALDEIIKFWENHLIDISTAEQQQKFRMIKNIATSYELYIEQRLKKFEQAINGIIESGNGILVNCPVCGSSSFAVFKDNEKECKCFVCDKKYKNKSSYLEEIRGSEEKKSTEKSFLIPYKKYSRTCLSCKKETRVRYIVSNDVTEYFCLNCFSKEVTSKMEILLEEESVKFNLWIESLYKTHTEAEVQAILKQKLKELDTETEADISLK